MTKENQTQKLEEIRNTISQIESKAEQCGGKKSEELLETVAHFKTELNAISQTLEEGDTETTKEAIGKFANRVAKTAETCLQ